MTVVTHGLDLVPLRRTPPGAWVEAGCWLDQGIERIVLGCLCGWRHRDLTTADLGVAPAAFFGEVDDDAAFTRLSDEMEAAHAAGIVPALLDLAVSTDIEPGLLAR